MYLSFPHRQPAPGTELVERYYGGYGLGSYIATQDYFLTPAGESGIRGLGCGMGCGEQKGVGAFMDGSGVLGTGLFTSSSPSDWGVGEWATIGVGAFAVLSMLDTGRRGYSAARKKTVAVKRALRA